MKKEHSKITKKIIMSIIAIIMLCNFVMPSFSFAASTEDGGSAATPLASFLCFLPDVVTNLLQHMFISVEDIEIYDYTISNSVQDYKILYSPGIIFSGTIPAFDINFIKPGEDKKSTGNPVNMYSYKFYEAYCDDKPLGEADVINWTNKNGITYRIAIRPNGTSSTESDSEQTFTLLAYDEEDNAVAWKEYKYVTNILEDQGGKTTQVVKHLMMSGKDSSLETQIKNIVYKDLKIEEWTFFEEGIGLKFGEQKSEDEKKTTINGKEYYITRSADQDSKGNYYIKISSKYGDEKEKELLNINTDEVETSYREDKVFYDLIEKDVEEKLETASDVSIPQEEIKQTTENFITQMREAIKSKYPEALGKEETREYKDSARIFQPIVAGWYKALRRIALVGLLSVLLYIGIRMVLSSTSAQDKAKYKKMFKDWLVALCLLFMLHYIMNLTITVVNQINSIIGKSVVGPEGEDVLITSLRRRILNGASWSTILSEVVIYAVITVYTVIFTIQYIRRTIYLAFLTTIAPLITLTYPLDKIKDGKAQAFDMWIKDYVFFTLLQVVHLLLYYIFVQTSVELAEMGNWIYAIVAIGFLTTAEKLMKKMFGFEKSKSMGTLAAGATGALVMNALNKLSHSAPKNGGKTASGNGSGGGTTKNVRTASTNPLAGLIALTGQSGANVPVVDMTDSDSNNTNGTQPQNINAPATSSNRNLANGEEENTSQEASGAGSSSSSQSSAGGTQAPRRTRQNGNAGQNSTRTPTRIQDLAQINNNRRKRKNSSKPSVIGGIRAVTGRYLRPTVGKTTGVLLSATGGIIGFSAGVAQGDFGKAITGAAGGLAAGYYGGQKLTNAAFNAAHTITHSNESFERFKDTWREGTYGAEEAQNVKFDREFRRSEGYRNLRRNNTNFSDESIQKMLDAGITDPKKMDKILKNNAKHPRKFSIEKAIGYSNLAEKCPKSILYNDQKFIKYFHDRDINITPDEIESMRQNIMEFK